MGPPPDANLDWESLIPEIELFAKAVGRRKNASPRVRDELAHLAVSFILEKSGHFDEAKGSFRAWCQTVLQNKCVELIKKEAVDRGRLEAARGLAEERDRDSRRPPEDGEGIPQIDWPDVFDKLKLKPMDRLLFSLDVEICDRFPAEAMAAWVSEAGLPPDFPVKMLRNTPKKLRNEAISKSLLDATGVEPGVAAVRTRHQWIRTRLSRVKTRVTAYLKGLL